jgi:hypothetical protein
MRIQPPKLRSGYIKIAIENDHLWLMYLVKILISHSYSYVSLPEGMGFNKLTMVFVQQI